MNIGAAWKQMLTVAEQRRRQAIGLREKPGDLVQRLRDRAYAGLPDPLLEDAANEIERLRDELSSATRHMELAEAAWLRETAGNPPVTEPLPKEKRA